MTGFGYAKLETREFRVCLEMRSLNSRFLEIGIHLPAGMGEFEPYIRKQLRRKIRRGRLTLNFSIEKRPKEFIYINKELAKTYIKNLQKLKKSLNLKNSLSLNNLINLPGVIELKEKASSSLSKLIKAVLKKALAQLLQMRREEGRFISEKIKEAIRDIQNQLKNLKKAHRIFLSQREKAFANPEERANFLKEKDIQEELSRFSFYLKALRKKISAKNIEVGKSLDFISQELLREINTLGAKSETPNVGNIVIEIKTQIERIREQVQNVE